MIVATVPTITVTEAVPDTPSLTALTVAVRFPRAHRARREQASWSTAPPPATTDQMGEIGTSAPAASLPTAVN